MVRPIFGPSVNDKMNAFVATANPEIERESARCVALLLQQKHRARGFTIEESRRAVASKLGIGAGTFTNVVKGRVKSIDSWIRARLQALLIRELEAEIARLTHELEMARQSGVHLASQQVGEIETYLAKALALLNGGGDE